MSTIYKIKLIEKILSPNNNNSYLIFELNQKFEFKEWQFVMLEKLLNWNKIKRAYSIVSTNLQTQKSWKIHFYISKASENWMSKYLTQDIEIWDTLDMEWPYWLNTNDYKFENYLFITTGSGVAPIIALYNNIVLETRKYNKIFNIFWERDSDYLIPLLEWIFENNDPNIINNFFLSREHINISKKNFLIQRWYVQDWIDKALNFVGIEWTKVFICWNPNMVNEIRNILTEKWFPKENIKFEKY